MKRIPAIALLMAFMLVPLSIQAQSELAEEYSYDIFEFSMIEELKKADHQFHMDGGSWTNDISWVHGYEKVLGPMEKVSSLFNETVLKAEIDPADKRYRSALFHLLASQTSCYRYWGQGLWTDYGREICRRAEAILTHDF